mmetsp:Transcript_73091/g.144958  ORF Transcript_73091/g.144958 Transcript_73091/m.144958 type:complete len:113 (-) Transcript_73091:45-383(-)
MALWVIVGAAVFLAIIAVLSVRQRPSRPSARSVTFTPVLSQADNGDRVGSESRRQETPDLKEGMERQSTAHIAARVEQGQASPEEKARLSTDFFKVPMRQMDAMSDTSEGGA